MTESTGMPAGRLPRSSEHRSDLASTWHGATSRRLPNLVNGVLSVVVGVAMLVWPNASLVVLAVLIAITLVANGLVQIVVAVTESDSGGRRVLGAVLGALSLLAGALCLRAPLQTLALLAVLIGSWWVVNGVLTLVGAMADDSGRRRGWTVFSGVVSVVAGLVVLLRPGISLGTLAITVGTALVVLGVLMTIDAFRAPAGPTPG